MKIYFAIFLNFCISNIALANDVYQEELLQSVNQVSENECKEVKCLTKIEKGDEKLPSPTGALILGIFPGIFLHGSGHFYIDDYLTGGVLLGIEGIGIFLIVLSDGCYAVSAVASALSQESVETSDCARAGISGGVLFFGSWLYDVIAAPIKASKMREEYEKKKKEKENVLKPEIGFMPMSDKDVQSSSGEVSFLSSYYKVQNTRGDINGGMILLTWRW